MSIKQIVAGTKVLGLAVAAINHATGRTSDAALLRAAGAAYGISANQVANLKPLEVLPYSLDLISRLTPDGLKPLGDALSGIVTMAVRSTIQRRVVISYNFLKFVIQRALDSDTVMEYLRRDPDFEEGDITADDVISMLYSSSPALAESIESLEHTPLNDPKSAEFAELTAAFDTASPTSAKQVKRRKK